MFSIIRAILYTQVFGVTGYYAGSDIAGPLVPYQALEPKEVSSTWDLGPANAAIHAPYNNTPYYTLSAFAVNDTQWCPAIAMSQENGCITLHADADGKAWPALLQVLSLISADGIQEAGWYTAQGASVPGFVCNAVNVDLSCLLPGDTNTTNSTAYETYVANSRTGTSGADSPYGWDPEILAGENYPTPVPAVTWKEVGSGPYYLAHANNTVGYTLEASPDYEAPTGCAGQVGCLPEPGQYVQKVVTYWADSSTPGISAFKAGYADAASFALSDYHTMDDLEASGQLGLLDLSTMSTNNFGFNTKINLGCLASIDSSPPQPIDIPANAFAYEGLRATLEYAYPYATAQALGNVVDGVDLGNPFGGFLPPSETAFYNANTPWPNYNNVTDSFSNPGSGTGPGSPRWYWNETYNDTQSTIYDSELTGFTSSHPLYIPVLANVATPSVNAVESAWGDSVRSITGGVVQFQPYFVPNLLIPPCISPPFPVALWPFGWTSDIPSPAGNWEVAYGGSGLWGQEDALDPTFGGGYNASTCGHSDPTLANLTYWASQPDQVVPQDCQGTAFNVTAQFAAQATSDANPTVATELWDLVQDVYNNLQLTVGAENPNAVFAYAPWINPSSINEGVLISGSQEWCYYGLAGNGLY
jgi:hypothetical protein